MRGRCERYMYIHCEDSHEHFTIAYCVYGVIEEGVDVVFQCVKC